MSALRALRFRLSGRWPRTRRTGTGGSGPKDDHQEPSKQEPSKQEPSKQEPSKQEPSEHDGEFAAAAARAAAAGGQESAEPESAQRPAAPRPTPGPRPGPATGSQLPVGRAVEPAVTQQPERPTRRARARPAPRRLGAVLLAPPVLLTVAVSAVAVVFHRGRLGLDLAGGRVLPPEGLTPTWTGYLADWHPLGGGTTAPAPAAQAVVGLLGAPVLSPAVGVSLVVLAALPLAALSAYVATRAVPASRWVRALVAGGYALLPAATASLAQGRLDVVVVHVLLPVVLAGVAGVVRGGDGRRRGRWLSAACATALGLAVLGAFSPAVHLLVLVVALLGYVVAPAPRALSLRRGAGLFVVVLLPLGLLMPWPAVLISRPEVVVHGVGAIVPERWPGWFQLATLDPGGRGAIDWLGAVVLVAAALAVVLRPTRGMLPGLALVLLGAGAAVLIGSTELTPLVGGAARPGFTGGALLFAAAGLLWVVLLGSRAPDDGSAREPSGRWPWGVRLAAAGGVLGVLALAAGAVVTGGSGRLGDGSAAAPLLAAPLAADVERGGDWVLVPGTDAEPARMTRGGTARFADDAIAPLPASIGRVEAWSDALRSQRPGEISAAVAAAAASGVEFVVLDRPSQARTALAAATGLARSAPDTADGRPVLRLLRPNPGAVLLGPALAREARSGAAPPIVPTATGVPVVASPPAVAAQVGPGAEGRLLVVPVNEATGWRATVGGNAVPVVRAWGHLVGVDIPAAGAEVRVEQGDAVRTALLLVQAAVILLAVGTALPARRRDRS